MRSHREKLILYAFLLLCLVASSRTAFADEYTVGYYRTAGVALAHCQAAVPAEFCKTGSQLGYASTVFYRVLRSDGSPTQNTVSSQTHRYIYFVILSTGACPEGTTEDSTGYCAPDEFLNCAADVPQFAYFRASVLTAVPGQVCDQQCAYVNSGTIFDDSDSMITANYTATGAECGDNDVLQALTPGTPVQNNEGQDCYLNYGLQFCNDPNDPQPTCFTSDGLREVTCPEKKPNSNCGFVNGMYTCVDKRGDGDPYCGQVNGELVCFLPDDKAGSSNALPISTTSPDNPRNGGNADGDPTNDVFANETEVVSNGLTKAQIQQAMQEAIAKGYSPNVPSNAGGAGAPTSGGSGSPGEPGEFDDSGIIEAINGQTGDLTDTLDGLLGGDAPGLPGIGELTDPVANALADASDLVGDAGTGVYSVTGQGLDGFNGTIFGMMPAAGNCAVLTYDLVPGERWPISVDINLCHIETVRTLLEWAFYVATVWTLFSMAVATRQQPATTSGA